MEEKFKKCKINCESILTDHVEDFKIDGQCNDLYPERKAKNYQNWFQTMLQHTKKTKQDKLYCENNVSWCLNNSPLVKILLGGLQVSGCEFSVERHTSCELCHASVSGGFDINMNQVVICQNVAVKKSTVEAVLIHEMTHMIDYCQNNLDFQNIHHLACSEIRAANLANCSFLSAWFYGYTSILNVKASHKDCVKKKALSSLLATKRFTEKESVKAIDEVFIKCYYDLEPIGRRCRRNSINVNLAYIEAPLFGYNYKI